MDSDRYSIHFSPLQGYTDRIYRNAFAHYFGGVEVYYTPFIRVEKGALRKRDLRDIEPETNTVADLIPQILPGSADEFRLLTDAVGGKGYRQIDINLGCPFPMIAGKHVLVLAASVTTGFTVQGAVEAIRYYGGDPVGIASIFASVEECAGYPVASIFDTHDLPDYETYDSHSCPWCRQGKKIDALVNSFGYSSL